MLVFPISGFTCYKWRLLRLKSQHRTQELRLHKRFHREVDAVIPEAIRVGVESGAESVHEVVEVIEHRPSSKGISACCGNDGIVVNLSLSDIADDSEVKRLILACWRGADELRAEVSSTVMPKGKKNGGNAGSGGSQRAQQAPAQERPEPNKENSER